jgi:alkylated DNA repair dioxygenase AlkB
MMDGLESVEEHFGCGDSFLILNILPESLINDSFLNVKNEISWNEMSIKGSPVPRLVSIQGDLIDDCIEPVYRYPVDSQPALTTWTPAVELIRNILKGRIKCNLNHALIQLYRSGKDNISEHSDKTLDITKETAIYTLSLGSKRTLILRSKIDKEDAAECADGTVFKRDIQKIPLPHNSLFILGWRTNLAYLHSIKADKRAENIKGPDETFCGGQRISLTFRSIATFRNKTSGIFFGQGAPKGETVRSTSDFLNHLVYSGPSLTTTREAAVVAVDSKEKISEHSRLMNAFSEENKKSNFDWDLHYGCGFG